MAEYIVRETDCGLATKQEIVGELVRCKECKHYNAGFECLKEGYGIEYPQDWYCADGERKDDE